MSRFDITVATTIEQDISIWAIPRSQWHIDRYPDECPYTFAVRTDDPYDTGAVKVFEANMEFDIPAGINVTEQAIETYKEAQRKAQLDADERINMFEEKIKALIMLTHQPDLSVVPQPDEVG